jgi:hypothetical protein
MDVVTTPLIGRAMMRRLGVYFLDAGTLPQVEDADW